MPLPSPQPTSTRQINFNYIPSTDPSRTTFNFRMAPKPDMTLKFSPREIPQRPRKRRRTAGDVDGENSCPHNKKRRLRLFLITSRLSPQYSQPATNIVHRGHSKIAVWAKQKALGRNLLCKASILNRIRRQAMLARDASAGLGKVLLEQEREQEHIQLATLTLKFGSHDTYTHMPRPSLSRPAEKVADTIQQRPPNTPPPLQKPYIQGIAATTTYKSPNDAYFNQVPLQRSPRRSYLPLPPSPLGLSNYDAFDQEDDMPDPYAHLDEEYEATPTYTPPSPGAVSPPQTVYSDFGVLDPDEPVLGDYDQVDEGACAIWPSTTNGNMQLEYQNQPHQQAYPVATTSPNIPALFAALPAATTTAATSSVPNMSLSPTAQSPNFTSPLLSPALTPLPTSPNLDDVAAGDTVKHLGFCDVSGDDDDVAVGRHAARSEFLR
ncbi:unnamed protein product [Periconia digitata]|uniref:Uncharacterized protein n=1 Tax=Periconia digitata TaxID=1303443 RepID=A0A9W4UTP8_9PLEO|nr:unnamed protein product [Periconia digitata]